MIKALVATGDAMPLKDFSIGNEGIMLDGYPEGAKVVSLGNELEKRMSAIRVGQTFVARATGLLEYAITIAQQQEELLLSALSSAAVGWYMACFASSELGPKLDYKKVFSGNDDAISWHLRWKRIRDKHHHHPGEIGRSVNTGTIIDSRGEFVELFTIKMTVNAGADRESLDSLLRLLKITSDYLDGKATETNESAKREFQHLEQASISAACPLEIRKPLS